MSVPFWTAAGTIDLENLRAEDLTAWILGSTLAKQNRFGGRTPEPWSVAAHSVLVEHLCPVEIKPWALLHDAHEAFVGDLMTPSVEFIARCSPVPDEIWQAINHAKGRIDRAIGHDWGVPVRSLNAALRQADHIACIAEAEAFLGIQPGRCTGEEESLIRRARDIVRDLYRHIDGDWRGSPITKASGG